MSFTYLVSCFNVVWLIGSKSNELCLSSLLGNFVSTKYNLSSAYMPSFQKKEVGSVGQRIQLAPLAGQHASKMFFHLCKADKIIPNTFRSDNVPTYQARTNHHIVILSNYCFYYPVRITALFHGGSHTRPLMPSMTVSTPQVLFSIQCLTCNSSIQTVTGTMFLLFHSFSQSFFS